MLTESWQGSSNLIIDATISPPSLLGSPRLRRRRPGARGTGLPVCCHAQSEAARATQVRGAVMVQQCRGAALELVRGSVFICMHAFAGRRPAPGPEAALLLLAACVREAWGGGRGEEEQRRRRWSCLKSDVPTADVVPMKVLPPPGSEGALVPSAERRDCGVVFQASCFLHPPLMDRPARPTTWPRCGCRRQELARSFGAFLHGCQ